MSISESDGAEREDRAVEEHARLPVKTVYQIVRQEGQEQMERPGRFALVVRICGRPFDQLFAPGTSGPQAGAAGRAMGAAGVELGYSVGFLMVILARQQLFTETTITVVLPLLAEFTRRNLWRMVRMWGLVLTANFAGTLVAALFSPSPRFWRAACARRCWT